MSDRIPPFRTTPNLPAERQSALDARIVEQIRAAWAAVGVEVSVEAGPWGGDIRSNLRDGLPTGGPIIKEPKRSKPRPLPAGVW